MSNLSIPETSEGAVDDSPDIERAIALLDLIITKTAADPEEAVFTLGSIRKSARQAKAVLRDAAAFQPNERRAVSA